MVLFVAFINVVLFGALVYVADRGEWHEGTREYIPDTGPPSDMESVPLTMWFVLIVQGSVGCACPARKHSAAHTHTHTHSL